MQANVFRYKVHNGDITVRVCVCVYVWFHTMLATVFHVACGLEANLAGLPQQQLAIYLPAVAERLFVCGASRGLRKPPTCLSQSQETVQFSSKQGGGRGWGGSEEPV